MKKIENLINLIKENPDLPIVPMVDSEVVMDDEYRYWMGSFGNSYVGEYTFYDDIYFDDREDFKEYYYDYNDDELLKANKENMKLIDEYLDKIADEYFTKAIIVYIGLPD